MRFKSYQSEKSLTLQCRRKIRKSYSRNRRSAEKFREVCRILQGVPGYKLHPSGLVIESVGDLSVLSQESFGLLIWNEVFSFETPETEFSEPCFLRNILVVFKKGRQYRKEQIAKGSELGIHDD